MTTISLVTGASRGLGRNTALHIARGGGDVIITWQSNAEAAETFVANPALLRPDLDLAMALFAALKIAIGIALLSYATIGAGGRLWTRAAAAILGLCLIFVLRG